MTCLLRRICDNGATLMLDMLQSSLSWSLLLLDSYPLYRGTGSSSLSGMQLASSFRGVPAGVKGGYLDAAIGTDAGAFDSCMGSAAGDGVFVKAAFCKVFVC